MIITSVFNDKGGVGKSALTCLLAEALATAGFKVLVIDNDPQGTISFENLKIPNSMPGIDEVYSGNMKILDVITPTEVLDNLFVIPAGMNLKEVVKNMIRNNDAEQRVGDLFDQLYSDEVENSVDFVFIDNPPSDIGHPRYCTMNAHKIVIPAIPDDNSFSALYRAYGFMEKNYPNWDEQQVYIVRSIVKGRKLQKRFIKAIDKEFSNRSKNTKITKYGLKDTSYVPETIFEGKNYFISRNSDSSSHEIKMLCLEIFDEIKEKDFIGKIDMKVKAVKKAYQDKFIEMAEKRRRTAQNFIPTALDKIKEEITIKASK